MYPYVIFDLDGTLLNTIDDLAGAGNHVCRLHGWPTHSVDEFKRMVGNGIPKLVERFAPEGTGAPVLEQALGEFMAWYGVHKADQTAPYPGMLQAVRRLKEAGVSIAVLSNKADEMAGPVVEGYYPQIFPLVQGALTGIPTKPDPTLLHRLMERMGASQENTLFVGDSNVDIQTAKNGGLTSCGVLWGFRSRQELEQEGADYLASTPEDLLTLILGEKGGRETRHLGPEDVEEAAAILRSGGLVGIPTETVYGLGANGLDPEAVAHIFEAKGRPQDNPLILHIPSADHLERYCADIPQSAFDLARACWPGPLTMILKRRPIVPDVVTAGMDTVGMRCPSHPVCRAILQAAEVPVAAQPHYRRPHGGGHGRKDRCHRGRRSLLRGGGVHHRGPDGDPAPAAAARRYHAGAAGVRPGPGGGGPGGHPADVRGRKAPGPGNEVPPLRPQGAGDSGGRSAGAHCGAHRPQPDAGGRRDLL